MDIDLDARDGLEARIAPTRRPAGAAQGLQQWRHLLFVHWEVPVSVLRPLIPPALEVDTYKGRAFVGLVPFTMRNVRPFRFLPAVPGTADFHETNVRTYVRRAGGGDPGPGVWFFSLDAASRLAVLAARTFFHLPYYHADMDLQVEGAKVSYRSERRSGAARLQLRYEIGEPLPASEPGTLQFFLAERYYLYTVDREQRLLRGQVHHKPYPLHKARVERLEESLLGAAAVSAAGELPLKLYSPGVDVEVFALARV
ncbi:MAG TPA: DUF2071 domain-containing protein [Pseudomonadota bacterium]|nr:DUF2071 domain-containing protein [Pseudomonadota bacterium]